MKFWVKNQFENVIFDKEKTAEHLYGYFLTNQEQLRGCGEVLVGTQKEGGEENVWIEMKACCEGNFYLEVEGEWDKTFGTFQTTNTSESIKEAYYGALETFFKQI